MSKDEDLRALKAAYRVLEVVNGPKEWTDAIERLAGRAAVAQGRWEIDRSAVGPLQAADELMALAGDPPERRILQKLIARAPKGR